MKTIEELINKINIDIVRFKNLSFLSDLLDNYKGEDWKEKSLDLVAWKIVFMDKEKKTVFSSQSFLWDHKK